MISTWNPLIFTSHQFDELKRQNLELSDAIRSLRREIEELNQKLEGKEKQILTMQTENEEKLKVVADKEKAAAKEEMDKIVAAHAAEAKQVKAEIAKLQEEKKKQEDSLKKMEQDCVSYQTGKEVVQVSLVIIIFGEYYSVCVCARVCVCVCVYFLKIC